MNLVKVAHVANCFKFEMIKSKLLASGIQCYAYDSNLPTHGINDYQIQVIESDVKNAIEIIKSFDLSEESI